MAGKALKTCELRIKCKVGTTTSGADATNTISFSGSNSAAEAQTLMDTVNAIQSLRSVPVLEVVQREDFLVSDDL